MNISKKISAFIKITRPVNVVITFLVVIVAIFISQKEQVELFIMVLASLAAALTAAAGNVINDIFDIETDRISHPDRVMVVELLSKKEAWIEYVLINIFASFVAIYLSQVLFVFVILTALLLYLYSYRLKKLPLFGNFIIALFTGLAFIYGGLAAGNINAAVIPAIFAFLINLIREILKDVQDIDGDSKLKYQTFPIRFGIIPSKRLINLISLLLISFTFYPFITQQYKIEYFAVAILIVNPILVLCLKYLFDKSKENNLDIISKLLKLNMIIGLLAIYLGK